MTPEMLEKTLAALLEPHEATTGRVFGGTGFFIDDRLVIAVLGSRLCFASGLDDNPPASPLEFARRPVPGWSVIEASMLDEAAIRVRLEKSLAPLGRSI